MIRQEAKGGLMVLLLAFRWLPGCLLPPLLTAASALPDPRGVNIATTNYQPVAPSRLRSVSHPFLFLLVMLPGRDVFCDFRGLLSCAVDCHNHLNYLTASGFLKSLLFSETAHVVERELYEFGTFRLDLLNFPLSRGGDRVPLFERLSTHVAVSSTW